MHLFNYDPQSGAGNCTCGAAERHRLHLHHFLSAAYNPEKCTCGLGMDAFCHW